MEAVEHPLIKFSLSGVRLDITEPILLMFIAAVLVFLMVMIAGRRAKLIPGKFQNMIEMVVDFIRFGIVDDMIGKEGKPWFPFIATLFLFILMNNLLGLIPGREAATAFTGTTVSWAVLVFLAYHAVGIKHHGLLGYLRSFIPAGVPIALLPIMLPVEIISHFFRPLTLSLRLFANIFAGHQVLAVFAGLAFSASWLIKWLPFAGLVAMYGFEVFVSFIQAYIFAVLTAIYINGAIHIEH
jgi:F-type H+-transporting ATPase subunit a